jgi:hypothetical protein
MSTTKAFLLAGLTVVSLGVGQAMAQDGGGAVSDYWAGEYRAEAARQAGHPNSVATMQPTAPQYGSSDVQRQASPFQTNPFHDSNMTDGGL